MSPPLEDAERLALRHRRQAAARAHQPNRIRLLLVADAPAADSRDSFYFEDGEAGDLFDGVAYVLFEEHPSGDRRPYLKALRRRGVFLIDFAPDAAAAAKPAEVAAWLPLRVETLAPERVVAIGAAVYRAARPVLKAAGLPLVEKLVPAPAAGEVTGFAREFRAALVKAGLEKLIRPLSAAERASGGNPAA